MSDESNIHPEIGRYVELCRTVLGVEKEDLRILDYGCGAGEAVTVLRRAGYDVVGADISRDAIAKGRLQLTRQGENGEQLLQVIGDDGRTPFADASFNFVFSQQVFEHVVDLDVVARELFRVTMPGGMGFHVLPAPKRVIESHYLMPLVHWLPKNRVRHLSMVVFSYLGIGNQLPKNAGPRERADFQYTYSVNETFYRTSRTITSTLNRAGFDVARVMTNHRSIRARPKVAAVVDAPVCNLLARGVLETFFSVAVLTRKPSSEPGSTMVNLGGWRSQWRLAGGRAASAPSKPAASRPGG